MLEPVEKPPAAEVVAATRVLLGLPPLPQPAVGFAPPALQQASRSIDVATQAQPRACKLTSVCMVGLQVAWQTGQRMRGPIRQFGAVALLVAPQAVRDLEADRTPKPAITTHAQATHATDTPQPRVKKAVKRLRKKASFRLARGVKRRPAAPVAAEPPPWRNKAVWMQLPEEERWKCLPEDIKKFAKPGAQSFTCKVTGMGKTASIECLLRDRAYWVRNPAAGAEACQRHHAWLKNDGPLPAWEAARRAAGVA